MKSAKTDTVTWPLLTPVTSCTSQAWLSLNRMLQDQRSRRMGIALVYAILVVLYLATHAQADFAEDLISDLQPSAVHDQFWEDLWQATFESPTGVQGSPDRLAFGAIGTVVRWITLIALFVVLLHYGSGMMQSGTSLRKGSEFTIRSVFPVVIILALLANQFAGVHAVGLFVNQARLAVKGEAYAQTEFATTFRNAIKDAYFSERFRESLGFKAQECERIDTPIVALPSPERPTNPDPPLTDEQRQLYDKLDCIKSIVALIQEQQAIVDKECANGCVGTRTGIVRNLKQYGDRNMGELTETIVIATQFFGDLATTAAKHGAQETYRLVFRAIQWVWTTFLNMGFYLTAVGAPITYAISLMPSKRHFLFDLNLFSLLMFSLAEFGYIICLGIVALMLQRPTFVDLGGYIFPLTYGLLAPLVSASMFYGGFKAASNFRGGALGVAGAAGGIAGGIATSAVIAVRNRREQYY